MSVRIAGLALAGFFFAPPLIAGPRAAPVPYLENFNDFSGKIVPKPEIGELDSGMWVVSPNLSGGTIEPPDLPASLEKAAWTKTVYAWRSEDNTAMALRGAKGGTSVTLHLTVSASTSHSIAVEYEARLLREEKRDGGGRVELAWSTDGQKFTVLHEGSITFTDEGEWIEPRVDLSLPTRPPATAPARGRRIQFGPIEASLEANSDLYLRWSVPPQGGLVTLDDISVHSGYDSNLLVAWVSVDSNTKNAGFLRELLRQKLNSHGFPAIACEAELESEIDAKRLMAAGGTKTREDNPTRAVLLSLMNQAGCKTPPHSRVYTAHLAVHEGTNREAVLRLTPLQGNDLPRSFSISEPRAGTDGWTPLVDKLVQKATGKHYGASPLKPVLINPLSYVDIEPFTIADEWTAIEVHRARMYHLFRCSNRAACREFLKTQEELLQCRTDGTPCYASNIDVAWAASQKRVARPISLPGGGDGVGFDWDSPRELGWGNSSVRLVDRALQITEPGEYVLTVWDGSALSDLSPYLVQPIRVLPFSNSVRISAGLQIPSPSFWGDIAYHRLIGRTLRSNFSVGLQGVLNTHGNVLLGASVLVRQTPAGYLFGIPVSVDETASVGPSFGLHGHESVYAAVTGSLGLNLGLIQFFGDERYVDTSSTEGVIWVGPRFGFLKILDGSNSWKWLPSLQATTEW